VADLLHGPVLVHYDPVVPLMVLQVVMIDGSGSR
jgi:hypothetical protein